MSWSFKKSSFYNELYVTCDGGIKSKNEQPVFCGESYNINEGEEQIITSPNYPYNYEDYLVCDWTITTNPGNSLVVNVVDFHTQELFDVLEIDDGSNNIGEWSGDSGPPNFTSLSNEVSIIFKTDSMVNEKGFKIIITVSGGSGSGDPHMITFDGRRYSFQGQCWYTFFKDCSAHPDFEVITKFAPRDDIKDKTRTVSFKVLSETNMHSLMVMMLLKEAKVMDTCTPLSYMW
ncbi:CUB domain-containing protein 2-like [Saccoglossus kowalevskii]|uniref:CUB and sushi domain-containing protein 3-like n=1 Tax=Saccoglossus kowalevskii TaxID=10224 RepID=A0ABM0MMD4_SACKO|nr:PREDICTED: CUB and sushi domain-containing protein 3-like [Saccoglossus kowalevskii]